MARTAEQMKPQFRDELFLATWRQMPMGLRRKLKDLAYYPTASNRAFVVGYLAALNDTKQIPPETYTYTLALAGQLEAAQWAQDAVILAEI